MHRLLTINGKPYPFQSRAQVVERDTVFVPSGWDSWNKIKVLREGFDCESISEGWDENMDADNSQTGAIGIYQEAIPNEESDSQVSPLNNINFADILIMIHSLSMSLWLLYVKTNKSFMNVILKHFKRQ